MKIKQKMLYYSNVHLINVTKSVNFLYENNNNKTTTKYCITVTFMKTMSQLKRFLKSLNFHCVKNL